MIAWSRESMSRRNPSSMSTSSQKSRGKSLHFFLMFDAQERPLWTTPAFKSYISGLRFTSSTETEDKLALERPLLSHNATSNITYSIIADQHSSQVATTFNARCTIHCTVEDLNVKKSRLTTRSRYDTIPCCVHVLAGCASMQRPGTATGATVQSGDIVHCVYLCKTKVARTAVLLGEVVASHKLERQLPILSILSAPGLGAFSLGRTLLGFKYFYDSIGILLWRIPNFY